MFCLERIVLFVSLFVSMPQLSLLFTPFERAIHDLEFHRILYVLHLYLLSYIVFALVLHLDLLEHGGGFVLKKLYLSCFTYIILRVLQNSMAICFNHFRHSRLIKKSYECVEYYEKFQT